MSKEWESVIGLEVHLQLKTGTKVWCSCSADYDHSAPNTHTCPICLGHPGVLPKLNEKVLDYAIKGALALNCEINKESKFDRKNYFYPDTPKNYQITQFDKPYAGRGFLDIKLNGKEKRVGITRVQIEEDAGKSIHGANESYINFNRASMPLIEIISEPDIRSSEEAYEYLNTLRSILKYTGISDVSMELGSLRCDANISVRKSGEPFGTRVEVKNLNSFKAVGKAIDYEIGRQIEHIENGGTVDQETRLWDDAVGITRIMRSKEEANDYRYFPEPDLVRVVISDERIERLEKEMPESKVDKIARFLNEYGIKEYDAEVLSEDIELAKNAIKFNETYIKFYELREFYKDFFDKKYDSKAAEKYTEELSKINVDDYKNLNENKLQILNDIKNYENSTCLLKNRIEALLNNKNVPRDEVLKNKILNFKNDYKKEFKYLQNIILETSKYPNNYNSESLNCIQNEMKQEVKESSTKKE